MNKVNLVGNLTKDPEVRYFGERAKCRFTLAVSDGFGEKKYTSYIPIVVWGRQAENCEKFLKKGNKVGVSGRIQTGSYDGPHGKVYTTDVVADDYGGIEFIKTEAAISREPEQIQGFTALKDEEDDIPW